MLESILRKIHNNKQLVKYLISGGTAAFVDILFLFLLTDILKIWYVYSAAIAFAMAFFISFCLQKFWTFRDGNKEVIYGQIVLYFFAGAVNLSLNVGGMYLLVDFFFVSYIFAQIIMGVFISISSFLVYRFVIFRKKSKIRDSNKANFFNQGKIKILIVSGIYPPDPGGPATYAHNLAREFENIGHEVKIVSYGETENIYPVDKKIYIISRRRNIFSRYFKFFWRVYRLMNWADIFYALDLVSAGFPAALVAKIKNKKIVLRTGGDFLWEKAFQSGWTELPLIDYYGADKNAREKFLIRFCTCIIKKFDSVIFSTSLQMDIYQKFFNLKDEKVQLISNVACRADVSNIKIRDEYKNTIVYGGRLIKLKNIDRLIEIFSEIKNANLLILGCGPEKRGLEEKIKNLKLESRVKISGSVSHNELISIMASSLFVVLPSVTEISPHLAMECLSMDKPIILTKNTGLDENIVKNIILINPLSREDIKEKIVYLLNPANLAAYKNKLKEVKIKTRTWNDVTSDHLYIFKELL